MKPLYAITLSFVKYAHTSWLKPKKVECVRVISVLLFLQNHCFEQSLIVWYMYVYIYIYIQCLYFMFDHYRKTLNISRSLNGNKLVDRK